MIIFTFLIIHVVYVGHSLIIDIIFLIDISIIKFIELRIIADITMTSKYVIHVSVLIIICINYFRIETIS